MPTLRLLADDLTGALDTAVEFVGLCGPIEIALGSEPGAEGKSSLAIDSGTRERSAADAVGIIEQLAPLLKGADIAFKKVDSLFRGPWAAELAAVFRLGHWRHCILAPAFPHYGRVTRNGRQMLRAADGTWQDVSGDLVEALAAEGLQVTGVAKRHRAPSPLRLDNSEYEHRLSDGISVFDADTDSDLDEIIALVQNARGPILWSGTGGLAGAMARGSKLEAGASVSLFDPGARAFVLGQAKPMSFLTRLWPPTSLEPTPDRLRPITISHRLKPPVLGLFGSDQPITRAQLKACGSRGLHIGEETDPSVIEKQLERDGAALVSVNLPPGLDRAEAAARIETCFARIARALPAPGTLIVAGGETLRGLCHSLGPEALTVTGQVSPGLPRSVISGGHWDKVDVISKSGAFGGPDLWRDLLRKNGLIDKGDGI
ncbi:hypothetical protein A6U86_30995 [Rhizobium sp. AC27/96]|uniref:four-carbon acid sugar kinase family protein n=1 Tax=Rhizobium sp. AC27/96 TaxID=1841653 RepID=UPI0008292D19|nr:four-carbon acid sugar kinase family protein [Rhizobium sp. AC27/96]OCJ03542.1 hypothetical protein A6U86_30995 [Rhizobium sp. AC27/96]